MRKLMQLTALAIAVQATTVYANDADQVYKLKRYPKDRGACAPLATELGQRLAATYGVEVTGARCDRIIEAGFDLSVTFRAAAELPLVTTGAVQTTIDPLGRFATEEACRATQTAEMERFHARTGLAPFVAYCYEEVFTEVDPWVLRIDAFGTAALRPIYLQRMLYGHTVTMTPAELSNRVAAAIISSGLDLVFINVRAGGLDDHVTALYYGDHALKFTARGVSRLETAAQCNGQLADANAMHRSLGIEPVATFCSYEIAMGYSLVELWNGSSGTRIATAAKHFRSFEGCQTQLANVRGEYERELGQPVLGAFCTNDFSSWNVVLVVAGE